MAIQSGEMILPQKKHGIRFPYRTPLTFVPSDKTKEFFDNMETDCDFKRLGLHVTGYRSIKKGPPSTLSPPGSIKKKAYRSFITWTY